MGSLSLAGRDFIAQDRAVAIIDDQLAAALFPGQPAVGHRIRYGQPPRDGGPADLEIVGVVARHRHEVFGAGVAPRVFVPLVPLARVPDESVFLYVHLGRTDGPSVRAAVPGLRQALREVGPDLPVLKVAPLVDLLDRNVELSMVRLAAVLFGLLGGIALLLAVVGVYGVKSYAVSRRTREIGIRMALGAEPSDVRDLVMKQGALQIALAVAGGLAMALAAGRVLGRFLYQVSPADPLVLAVASGALSAAALLACFLPARRATRVTPLVALRDDP
jgi:hypothetical protein